MTGQTDKTKTEGERGDDCCVGMFHLDSDSEAPVQRVAQHPLPPATYCSSSKLPNLPRVGMTQL